MKQRAYEGEGEEDKVMIEMFVRGGVMDVMHIVLAALNRMLMKKFMYDSRSCTIVRKSKNKTSEQNENTFAESLTSALLWVKAPHDLAKFITESVASPDPDPTP